MKTATRAPTCLTLILGCLLLAGCDSGDGLARVKGRVTLNGEPLEGAMVEFRPVDPRGSSSSAVTDAKGRYELMYTFGKRGAMPGAYAVSIRTAGTCFGDDDEAIQRVERVPAKYNAETELKRTVEPGRNRMDFDL